MIANQRLAAINPHSSERYPTMVVGQFRARETPGRQLRAHTQDKIGDGVAPGSTRGEDDYLLVNVPPSLHGTPQAVLVAGEVVSAREPSMDGVRLGYSLNRQGCPAIQEILTTIRERVASA
jgi:hypothetical protein